jgi:hypothetical protein
MIPNLGKMRRKKLSQCEKDIIAKLETHIPKVDSIYGLEGYCFDICRAVDIRKGCPVVCETKNCYSSVITYRWNNPKGTTDYERMQNPIGYFICEKCGAMYLEQEEDTARKKRNRQCGGKKLLEIGTTIKIMKKAGVI